MDHRIFATATATALCLGNVVHADCFDDAAHYHEVNAEVLRAIAYIESRNDPGARNVNSNGSVDYGLMQINSVHLKSLRSFGIGVEQLMSPCHNIYVAAWHLKQKVLKFGNTWEAIGAYHSETPKYRLRYAERVIRQLARQSDRGRRPIK